MRTNAFAYHGVCTVQVVHCSPLVINVCRAYLYKTFAEAAIKPPHLPPVLVDGVIAIEGWANLRPPAREGGVSCPLAVLA